MFVKFGGIKRVINKISLYTLCTFSLPFFAYGSAFEIPKVDKGFHEMQERKNYLEIDSLLKRVLMGSSMKRVSKTFFSSLEN